MAIAQLPWGESLLSLFQLPSGLVLILLVWCQCCESISPLLVSPQFFNLVCLGRQDDISLCFDLFFLKKKRLFLFPLSQPPKQYFRRWQGSSVCEMSWSQTIRVIACYIYPTSMSLAIAAWDYRSPPSEALFALTVSCPDNFWQPLVLTVELS